jgi:hypothetical protein
VIVVPSSPCFWRRAKRELQCGGRRISWRDELLCLIGVVAVDCARKEMLR